MNTPHPAVPDAVRVHPLQDRPLEGTIRPPGDKSLSHRALLLGALCGGPVRITGAAPSADVRATVAALRGMGVAITEQEDATLTVEGPPGEPADVLDCGNSGTAMRLLSGVCAGADGLAVLTGDASLRRRPMDRVAAPLRLMGASVDGRDAGRLAPLAIRGGNLAGVEYKLPVASAQVKSAVLLAGLRATGETRVIEPVPTRDHTERMLAWLGADAGIEDGVAWVKPGPLTARPLDVPADPSSAAFWMVAAAALPGSHVTMRELCLNPTRTGAMYLLRDMGASVTSREEQEWSGEPVGDLTVTGGPLGEGEVSGELIASAIDELPVLAVAGALGGGFTVRQAAELRVKESDRIDAVADMLGAFGVTVRTYADGFSVAGATRPQGGDVDSHGDHRIAMAAAVAALASSNPVTITGFGVVATSYPSFLDDLTALGGHWEAV